MEQEIMTPLMRACWEGNVSSVKALLQDCNVHVNEQNNTGKTAIMFAANQNHAPIVELLLENKADFLVWDHAGGNAFTSGVLGRQNRLLDRMAMIKELEGEARKLEMEYIKKESRKISDSIEEFGGIVKAWKSMKEGVKSETERVQG
jgi:hypothetical protein